MVQNIFSKMDQKIIYLVFQPVFKYFQTFTSTDEIFACKSKEFSEESFKTLLTSDNDFVPKMAFFYNGRVGAKFKGNCLI